MSTARKHVSLATVLFIVAMTVLWGLWNARVVGVMLRRQFDPPPVVDAPPDNPR